MNYNGALPTNGGLVTSTNRAQNASSYDSDLQRFSSIEEMVKALRPEQPVRCLHPKAFANAAKEFLAGFPGTTFYAVKSNPSPYALAQLYKAGIRHFDVASLKEIALLRDMFPDAFLTFMHPIKNRGAIRKAYFDYGVRDFAVDTFEELHKILEETKVAADLTIHVRMATSVDSGKINLSTKFGAASEMATTLLQDAAKVANKVGLCFHVGHLCLDKDAFANAISLAKTVIAASGVELDVFDVGGGFSRSFPGMDAPLLAEYFLTIKESLKALNLPKTCQVWSEPGLALASEGESLVVRVELRKGDFLYINDGTYGSLFDAAGHQMKKRFPVQLVRLGRKASNESHPFQFYGPTCDSIDVMPGPFMLPKDVREGDWIIIGNQGAYGSAMQTGFNGFDSALQVEICEASSAAQTSSSARLRKRSESRARLSVVTE